MSNRKSKQVVARRFAGIVAAAASVAAAQLVTESAQAGQTGNQLTLSLSGSTAMRNFTTSAGITEVNPGTILNLSDATGAVNAIPSDPNYWNNGGISYQFAPKSGAGGGGTNTGAVAAVRFEWHEQGSVEGILDLVNDQIGAVNGNAGTRTATSANPIWINQNKFTNSATIGAYTLGDAGAAQGQSAVQMAISDVNHTQAFSIAGAAAYNRAPGQAGYGLGNSLLANGGSNNLSSFGLAGSNAQLRDQHVADIASNTVIHVAYGASSTAGVGAWNTAGTGNLESNKVAATATLFVANPGTGLDKLNRTDAQALQLTGHLTNGAQFNWSTRDVGSGTRNVAANNIGIDPSWAVGVNDGASGTTAENLIGSMKFSNKTAGGNLRTTVQNARMGAGTLSISDAVGATQGGSAPLRGLSYSDSADGGAANYVLASAQTIVDGSYVIWQNETYVTVKNTDGSYGNAPGTAGANILGDTAHGDVKLFRNNILNSSRSYPASNTASTLSPADALLNNSFIPEQFLQLTKTVDGIGTTSANPTYNASNSASFLSNAGGNFTSKFAVNNGASATTITTGASSTYNGGGTNGVAITSSNYLFGNFGQNGTRDLAALKKAVTANSALEASGAGNSLFSGGGSATVITTGVGALDGMSNQSGGTGATKGDLIVMGDIDGRGVFDGKSLYKFATGAALADSAGIDTLTPTGGETFGDAVKRGVLVKNAALDYLQTNATAQQKTEAAVTTSAHPRFTTALAQTNAFNRFDVLRNGVVDLMSAAAVDKFVGMNPASNTDQIAAVVNSSATNSAGITSPGTGATNAPINLYQVKLVDGPGKVSNALVNGDSDMHQIYAHLNAANGGSGTGAGAVLLNGDTQFRGTVDLQDYLTLAQNFHGSNTKWSQGDSNFDGTVDLQDYLLLAQNFHAAAVAGGGSSNASVSLKKAVSASKTLTGGGNVVVPAGLVNPGNGKLALEVDPSNGHVYLVGNNLTVSAYNSDSAGGLFNIASGKNPYETLKINPATAASWNVLQAVAQHIAENVTNGTTAEPFAVFGSTAPGTNYYFDLTLSGGTLWTGTSNQVATDLAFDYGDGALQHHFGQVINLVPEPTTLGFIGFGAAGLLARRRRNQKTMA